MAITVKSIWIIRTNILKAAKRLERLEDKFEMYYIVFMRIMLIAC